MSFPENLLWATRNFILSQVKYNHFHFCSKELFIPILNVPQFALEIHRKKSTKQNNDCGNQTNEIDSIKKLIKKINS